MTTDPIDKALQEIRAGRRTEHPLSARASAEVDAHVRAGTLARILGPFEPPAIPVQVVTPAGRFVTPIVRAFVDASAEALRRTLGSSAG